MARFFNTAGPCRPARHYMLPAEERLPDVERLLEVANPIYREIIPRALSTRGGGSSS